VNALTVRNHNKGVHDKAPAAMPMLKGCPTIALIMKIPALKRRRDFFMRRG
jgi:hypothetical protein